ncbi:adenosylcobinamide amidohydrolase [Paenibacillus filicis]|uniref:Adenosylcobinamide amidohydrolase n=1 Tax=Paenibacillus gyeongsangnamensis TaxID=3388067 RepID=A0ABT4QC78_9BACL|nr:adenosylcobinamide amidohydrolase [Paenibacillus filicis]MCZ8514372.1 adenosylcobinamide amidohydrolase [Paenibacillus filicis]
MEWTATAIEGLRFGYADHGSQSYYLVQNERPMRTLNSSMWGEGFGSHLQLMNRQVDKSYHCDDPLQEMHRFMEESGLKPEHTAALLTAADLRDRAAAEWRVDEETLVCTWSTAGLGNKARAGVRPAGSPLYPGTINIIVVVDGSLMDAAFVNAVITATEAKAAALQELGVRLTDSGQTATGTTTDAVLVAATGRGAAFRYAGTATRLGYAIGRTVFDTVLQSGRRYLDRTGSKEGD